MCNFLLAGSGDPGDGERFPLLTRLSIFVFSSLPFVYLLWKTNTHSVVLGWPAFQPDPQASFFDVRLDRKLLAGGTVCFHTM